ncbi:MAG: serine protease [Pseudomonadota bacterium]
MPAEAANDEGLAALLQRVQTYREDGGDLEAGRALMEALKQARQFEVLLTLAEDVVRLAPQDIGLRKLRAQALLDTGQTSLARDALLALIAAGAPDDGDVIDAHGLLGRANKDLMLATVATDKKLAAHYAGASLEAYLGTFRRSNNTSWYHGINAAAVLHAANALVLASDADTDPVALGQEVLDALHQDRADPPSPWWLATRAEAMIAMDRLNDALADIADYIEHPGTTVFMLGGTWRQFTELWDVHHQGAAGKMLVGMLEATYLERSKATSSGVGARIVVSPEHLRDMREPDPDDAPVNLEAILGQEGVLSLQWYRQGLERAASVGLVTWRGSRRQGTCFIVDAETFGLSAKPGTVCALTNYHVVNREADGDLAIAPADARIRFEAADDALSEIDLAVQGVIAQSPVHEGLDYALIEIDAPAGAFLEGEADRGRPKGPAPLAVAASIPEPGETARAYVIGYPQSGTSLAFSLHDSRLLDHEGPNDGKPKDPDRIRVHYFSPTEPGSSGSPVFDDQWRCIALHHAGYRVDPGWGLFGIRKLNGLPGTYAANEGYWIQSVVADVKRQLAAR